MNERTLPIIDQTRSTCADHRTGMARALVREIAEGLAALCTANTEARIDVRSLPLSDADRDELAEMLGRGEVSMSIDVAGPSDVFETGFAGVWWVKHRGVDGQVIAEHIEIARIPTIAVAHVEDIKRAHRRLTECLDDSVGDIQEAK